MLVAPCALPLFAFAVSCFIIADRGKLCKGFFVLLLTKWRGECVGGWVAPPRLAAGRLSAAGSKAGLKVGSAPWQFPADRLAVWGKLAHVGIAVALMACGP